MTKRTAAQAFREKPLSAFAAAKARKALQDSTSAVIAPDASFGPAASSHGLLASTADQSLPLTGVISEPDVSSDADSLDLEDDAATANTAPAALPLQAPLSSFDHSRLVKIEQGVRLSLRKDEFVSCAGIYFVKVISGAASVYGAYLSPESSMYKVFAPFGDALPVITARFETTVIELRSTLDKLPNLNVLSNLWNKSWYQQGRDTFMVMTNESVGPACQSLRISDEMQTVLNRLSNPKTKSLQTPAVMVSGGKGSGKSTTCRCIVNALLTSPMQLHPTCYWLDLDPGQPEFGPPGQLSLVQVRKPLLGPSYTHPFTHASLPYRTIRAHTLAAASPREDMDHFISCVKDLVEKLLKMYRTVQKAPLIINCPGWITGSGAELIEKIAKVLPPSKLSPTNIILLDSFDNSVADLAVRVRRVSREAEITILPSHYRSTSHRSAAETRSMQAMSYFHSVQTNQDEASWSTRPLSSFRPWAIPYTHDNNVTTYIHAIASYHSAILPSQLATVIDQSPLALVIVYRSEAYHTEHSDASTSFIRTTEHDLPLLHRPDDKTDFLIPPLNPAWSRYLGHAIVHKIDAEAKTIHLLTPVSRVEVERALSDYTHGETPHLLLVRGKFDSADWHSLEGVHAQATAGEDSRSQAESLDSDFDLSESEDEEGGGEGEGMRYVSVRQSAVTGVVDEGTVLSERVWRPRHLPRGGGK